MKGLLRAMILMVCVIGAGSALYSSETAGLDLNLSIKEITVIAISESKELSNLTLDSIAEVGRGELASAVGTFDVMMSTNTEDKAINISYIGGIPAGSLKFYIDGSLHGSVSSDFVGALNAGDLDSIPKTLISGISQTALVETVVLEYTADVGQGVINSNPGTVMLEVVNN